MAALVKDITMSIVPFSENKQIAIIITLPVYFTEDNDNEKEEIKNSINERAIIKLSDIYEIK